MFWYFNVKNSFGKWKDETLYKIGCEKITLSFDFNFELQKKFDLKTFTWKQNSLRLSQLAAENSFWYEEGNFIQCLTQIPKLNAQ